MAHTSLTSERAAEILYEVLQEISSSVLLGEEVDLLQMDDIYSEALLIELLSSLK